jgi:hypothetical protein
VGLTQNRYRYSILVIYFFFFFFFLIGNKEILLKKKSYKLCIKYAQESYKRVTSEEIEDKSEIKAVTVKLVE